MLRNTIIAGLVYEQLWFERFKASMTAHIHKILPYDEICRVCKTPDEQLRKLTEYGQQYLTTHWLVVYVHVANIVITYKYTSTMRDTVCAETELQDMTPSPGSTLCVVSHHTVSTFSSSKTSSSIVFSWPAYNDA